MNWRKLLEDRNSINFLQPFLSLLSLIAKHFLFHCLQRTAMCPAEPMISILYFLDTFIIVLYSVVLEKGMTTHSSILVWRTPWTEEPGGLQTIGLQRVGHN